MKRLAALTVTVLTLIAAPAASAGWSWNPPDASPAGWSWNG